MKRLDAVGSSVDYLPAMRPWSLLLLLALPALGGCAARASYAILNAQRAYTNAVSGGADKYAPYELTLASEYLHKAIEEDGYASFEKSEQLAKASQDFSEKAVEASSQRKIDLENSDVVPEERVDKPVEKKDDTKIDLDVDDP